MLNVTYSGDYEAGCRPTIFWSVKPYSLLEM